MLEPWNDRNLFPPPVHTYQCLENIDIRNLQRTCKNAINVLSKQSPLHQEGAILSRFLYKYDKKFRNDIGYRIFKKVNTALRRYLMLNFLKDIENFSMVLPNDQDNQYLPTRQMLEYVLVRLVSLSKLMVRISTCCKQAAVFYLDRLKRGESHWMSLMPYALLSRLWSLSNVLLQHSCSWYLQMRPFGEKLQMKGLPFLPNEYELPLNLEEWLDLKSQESFGRFQWSHKNIIKVDPTLIEDTDGDIVDSLIMYINEINTGDDQLDTNQQITAEIVNVVPEIELTQKQINSSVDKGEVISRNSFKKFFADDPGDPQSGIKIKKDFYYHSIDRVTNKKTLIEFIDKEEKFRYGQNEKSLTNDLSFMQWQAFKTTCLKLCDSIYDNRKIQRKFMKIWQEKCVNCECLNK